MEIEVKNWNVDADVDIFKCHLGFLRINISHQKERYRYLAEVSSSTHQKGEGFGIHFDIKDTEGDNHGEIHIEFSPKYEDYYSSSSITHFREKETDHFVLVPWEKSAESFEFTQSNYETQSDLWGFDIDE